MTTYWLSDFCSLFNSLNINPFKGSDKNFKFNSLTRLIIFITSISAIIFNKLSEEIILSGLISICMTIIIYMISYNSAEMSISKELNSYLKAAPLLESQQEINHRDITKLQEKIINDIDINNENLITTDVIIPNTKLKERAYFLNENENENVMPSNVKPEIIPFNNSGNKKLAYGIIKGLHSKKIL